MERQVQRILPDGLAPTVSIRGCVSTREMGVTLSFYCSLMYLQTSPTILTSDVSKNGDWKDVQAPSDGRSESRLNSSFTRVANETIIVHIH